MRFTTAWANVLSENVVLKTVIVCLSLCCLILAVAAAKLAMKPPLIVERACHSTILPAASTVHTTAEIEAFVRETLSQRFDSTAVPVPGFLSKEEEVFRKQEQENLRSRNILQRIIFNSAKIDSGFVEANADRLLSVGDVRSAFPFPLSLTLSTVNRSIANPYGLMLMRVSPVEVKSK